MPPKRKSKVFVAMSGGVDSSVAALLLKKEGFDVFGVFMQGWQNPHFECTWRSDRQDAARVAALLGIPFRVLDFSREYYERVVSYLISEYKAGETPNPDVMCNKEIKFGIFFDWAIAQGADYIATGHYARKEGRRFLRAKDANKDQTYFLWGLRPGIIEYILFPIGSYTKPEVRNLAREFGLPTADKKDSQGICFVGLGNLTEFLKERIVPTPGLVRTMSGRTVGRHDGVELFTIGQRHGIGVRGGAGEPLYVADKDTSTATLIVTAEHEESTLYKNELSFNSANWLIDTPGVSMPFECEARIRYRAPLAKCTVFGHLDILCPNVEIGSPRWASGKVVFEKPQRAVAPGQSVVFYKEEELLGGGIIAKSL